MRPATIVISDWLANFRQNQWTPFEAGVALKEALRKEGYVVAQSEPLGKITSGRSDNPQMDAIRALA